MQTPSKVVEISPARSRDERSLKWIAMACVIVYLVSLGSIFGMAMMAVQASKEVHVDSGSGALVGADTGQPVAVDPITDYQINLSYELPFLPMAYLANVASLEFQYVDANNLITPAAYQIHAVRKTAEGRATFLTAVGDTITLDGSNEVAFLESDGVSYMIIVDGGLSAMDKGGEAPPKKPKGYPKISEELTKAMASYGSWKGVQKGLAYFNRIDSTAVKTTLKSVPGSKDWKKQQDQLRHPHGENQLRYLPHQTYQFKPLEKPSEKPHKAKPVLSKPAHFKPSAAGPSKPVYLKPSAGPSKVEKA